MKWLALRQVDTGRRALLEFARRRASNAFSLWPVHAYLVQYSTALLKLLDVVRSKAHAMDNAYRMAERHAHSPRVQWYCVIVSWRYELPGRLGGRAFPKARAGPRWVRTCALWPDGPHLMWNSPNHHRLPHNLRKKASSHVYQAISAR